MNRDFQNLLEREAVQEKQRRRRDELEKVSHPRCLGPIGVNSIAIHAKKEHRPSPKRRKTANSKKAKEPERCGHCGWASRPEKHTVAVSHIAENFSSSSDFVAASPATTTTTNNASNDDKHVKLGPCPGGCGLVHYCSRRCQTAAWESHAESCRAKQQEFSHHTDLCVLFDVEAALDQLDREIDAMYASASASSTLTLSSPDSLSSLSSTSTSPALDQASPAVREAMVVLQALERTIGNNDDYNPCLVIKLLERFLTDQSRLLRALRVSHETGIAHRSLFRTILGKLLQFEDLLPFQTPTPDWFLCDDDDDNLGDDNTHCHYQWIVPSFGAVLKLLQATGPRQDGSSNTTTTTTSSPDHGNMVIVPVLSLENIHDYHPAPYGYCMISCVEFFHANWEIHLIQLVTLTEQIAYDNNDTSPPSTTCEEHHNMQALCQDLWVFLVSCMTYEEPCIPILKAADWKVRYLGRAGLKEFFEPLLCLLEEFPDDDDKDKTENGCGHPQKLSQDILSTLVYRLAALWVVHARRMHHRAYLDVTDGNHCMAATMLIHLQPQMLENLFLENFSSSRLEQWNNTHLPFAQQIVEERAN